MAKLHVMAGAVNFIWNYCNDTSIQYIDKQNKWLSGYDLGYLTAGCSKGLGVNAQTIQAVAQQYATRRSQFKKRKLSWRSKKHSLGWVPFNGQSIKVIGDVIIYNKNEFRFWKSREIEGRIMEKTEKTIGEHVKELMTYSKKDLAVMYANLHWCYKKEIMTEKRTAEEILDGLEQTDDGYIHYSKVLPAMHEYAAQERDKVRNQAIDEMLEWIKEQQSNEMTDWGASLFNSTIKKLESLKTKP